MLTTVRSLQKGDTLIEVLFAVTVFSLVAVGSLSIMNQGTATAQRSLEITLVRQEIDAQAEALRFIHDSYIAAYPNAVSGEASGEWSKIVANPVPQASAFGTCPQPLPNWCFYHQYQDRQARARHETYYRCANLLTAALRFLDTDCPDQRRGYLDRGRSLRCCSWE